MTEPNLDPADSQERADQPAGSEDALNPPTSRSPGGQREQSPGGFSLIVCPFCAEDIRESAIKCKHCGEWLEEQPPDPAAVREAAFVRWLVPTERTILSILAGYAGLLSLLPFFGVLSLLLGLAALWDLKRRPFRHGRGRAWFAVIAGVAGIVFWTWLFTTLGAGS